MQRMVRQQPVTEHKYFSTVPEAVEHNATLSSMLEQYHATPEQLLNAMHRVAPDLVRRRVTFRHQLSRVEKANRQRVSLQLLSRLRDEPDPLQRMVFIDETTIMTHGLKHDHIEVWVNATDTGFHDYHGVPGRSWDPVKAHVVAAVSSHPSFEGTHGLVYADFTTGTTKIKRRENRRRDSSQAVPDFVYTVSGLLLANANQALGAWV